MQERPRPALRAQLDGPTAGEWFDTGSTCTWSMCVADGGIEVSQRRDDADEAIHTTRRVEGGEMVSLVRLSRHPQQRTMRHVREAAAG